MPLRLRRRPNTNHDAPHDAVATHRASACSVATPRPHGADPITAAPNARNVLEPRVAMTDADAAAVAAAGPEAAFASSAHHEETAALGIVELPARFEHIELAGAPPLGVAAVSMWTVRVMGSNVAHPVRRITHSGSAIAALTRAVIRRRRELCGHGRRRDPEDSPDVQLSFSKKAVAPLFRGRALRRDGRVRSRRRHAYARDASADRRPVVQVLPVAAHR